MHSYLGRFKYFTIQSLFIVLLFATTKVASAGGLSSWHQKTPNGNEIWYESSYPNEWHYLICGSPSSNGNVSNDRDNGIKITQWYFYQQHLIGHSYTETDTNFFVFNEQECNIILIQNQKEFENYLITKNLKPKVWTRWYNSYYGGWFYSTVNGTFAGLWILIKSVFVSIILLSLLYRFIKSKCNLKLLRNQLFIFLTLVVAFALVLDFYPNSF